MTSEEKIVEFHQKHLPTASACMIAAVLSLILFGLTKSYLDSKPLGMQSLYDSCSKICIDCFLIMAVINFCFMGVFICFWPVNPYVSFVLTLVSYFTLITTFVSLFFVQVVRYLYFTYPACVGLLWWKHHHLLLQTNNLCSIYDSDIFWGKVKKMPHLIHSFPELVSKEKSTLYILMSIIQLLN